MRRKWRHSKSLGDRFELFVDTVNPLNIALETPIAPMCCVAVCPAAVTFDDRTSLIVVRIAPGVDQDTPHNIDQSSNCMRWKLQSRCSCSELGF